MEAKKLMIGNWVEYCGKYFQIMDILTLRNYPKFTIQRVDNGEPFTIYGVRDVDPIPLNNLIIEKISIGSNPRIGCVRYILSENREIIYYLKGRYSLYIPGCTEYNIEYVHQLQNMLNVFDRDKEIVL